MEEENGYCAGCNEQFQIVDQKRLCPLCHCKLEAITHEIASMESAITLIIGSDERRAPSTEDDLVSGVFGGYEIERFLGRGGMAWVYKARHRRLHRSCAIKILCPWLKGRSSASLELFFEEARVAASVSHPNIVEIHNIGEADNYHFMELEFVPGRSLQDIIQSEGRLTTLESIEYLQQAAAALAEAHRADLIHRDIKPGNMLVRPDGFLKLADFGLAKRVLAPGSEAASAEQKLSGTPNFMAPELFRGEPASFRSDSYAIGVSLYYMLTGQFPFRGGSLRRIRHSHLNDPMPDLQQSCPEAAPVVIDFVERCLSKDPTLRPANGAALHDELRAILLTLRDLPSLVREAFSADLDFELQLDLPRLSVTVPLPGQRSQTVYIEESESHDLTAPLVQIYSLCGEADPAIYERALRVNKLLPFGSCGLDTIDGKEMLIMLSTVPHAACEPRHIRRNVYELAQQADTLESLMGQDDLF